MIESKMQLQQTGPISIDDVRAALLTVGGDPFATNAGVLQRIIGRGSNGTVQKHLETIRAEIRPPVEIAPKAIPKPPADAVDAMWAAAFTAAQLVTMARSEKLAAERDAALLKLEIMCRDEAGFLAALDEQAERLDQMASEQAAAVTHAAELAKELERTRQDLAQEKAQARYAAELAQRDAQIAAVAMQAALDTQIQKYISLKSMVDSLTPIKNNEN